MRANRRAFAVATLSCCLMLLLLTAVYQRMANPSLSRHLDHGPENTAAQTSGQEAAQPASPALPPQEAEALSQAMADLKGAPNDVSRILQVADIFNRNRDWANALAFLARATQAAPNDPRPWHHLGVTHAKSGNFSAAVQSFERAITIAPDNHRAHFNLAVIYRHYLNQPDRAAALLKTITDSPTADPMLKERAAAELARK